MDIPTPSGVARVTWHREADFAGQPAGLLLLGHGAGGGITAPDLLHAGDLARIAGMAVGLVEQPYRLLGRRAPAPAAQLDAAFTAVAEATREALGLTAGPVIVGGRSSGARVACRTAQQIGALGVLALAFPLRPPRPVKPPSRSSRSSRERPTRLAELAGCPVPVLVVQGERDPFGSAHDVAQALAAAGLAPNVLVSPAIGADHALRKGIDSAAVTRFLARFLP